MSSDIQAMTMVCRALSDETRLKIIALLQSGEQCACHISDALCLSQSKLSYHMKVLCSSKIVTCSYSGKWSFYKIDYNYCKSALELIESTVIKAEPEQQTPSCGKCS